MPPCHSRESWVLGRSGSVSRATEPAELPRQGVRMRAPPERARQWPAAVLRALLPPFGNAAPAAPRRLHLAPVATHAAARFPIRLDCESPAATDRREQREDGSHGRGPARTAAAPSRLPVGAAYTRDRSRRVRFLDSWFHCHQDARWSPSPTWAEETRGSAPAAHRAPRPPLPLHNRPLRYVNQCLPAPKLAGRLVSSTAVRG